MKNYKKQHGFSILAMILIIVALFSLISFVALRGTDINNVVSSASITNNLAAQAGIIRTRILACGIEYPSGNNGTGFRLQYPGATTAINISSMTCPGASNANIWSLLDGLSSPMPINGFGNWTYINDSTNMRIMIVANSSRTSLLPTLVNMLGPQASISGGNTLVLVLVN